MSPRGYTSSRRRAASDATKLRVMEAARELLIANGGAGFTIDAVAARADVARMTVYYQFGSKQRLRDALVHDTTGRGVVDHLHGRASRGVAPIPFDALAEFIGALVGFWAADRFVIRRLRHLAALEPGTERDLRAGDEHRVDALRHIVGRIAEQHGRPSPAMVDDVVRVLSSLTSFETFDAMAAVARTPEDVATLLIRAAHAVLGIEA